MKRILFTGISILALTILPALSQEPIEMDSLPPLTPQRPLSNAPYAVSPETQPPEDMLPQQSPEAVSLPEFPVLPNRPPIPTPPEIACPPPLGNGQAKPPLAWRVQAFQQARVQQQAPGSPVATSPDRYTPLDPQQRAPY